MRLKLSTSLHYPLIVRRIEKQVGDEVKPRDALFTYSYTTKVVQGEKYSDEDTVVDKAFTAQFANVIAGKIDTWLIEEGDTIAGPIDVVDIEEPCLHAVQFAGFCVECGADMTSIEMTNDNNPSRANIQIAHDSDKLLISQEEANELDHESKKRLLSARKLSLVVDLDQTIIHAAVDPTIGEWQKDPDNPNYEALKDVRAFQLLDDAGSRQECWYYIKLRPGLQAFLESISETYELHIYTMGTRQYAKKIAELVDPEEKFFGDRILSRDESGSMHAKNLTRIFPVDTRMVVIIDDRADVWQWSPNLIRVSQFEFFAGIGDINAGYLPKKQDIQITEKLEHTHPETNGKKQEESNGQIEATDTTALAQVINAASTANDSQTAAAQEEAIASQLEQKPLQRLQQEMDQKDGVDAQIPASTQNTESDSSDSETSSNSGRKRHSVLRNDDEELIHLERNLQAVHERFFADYDRKRTPAASKGGRVAALAGKSKTPVTDTTEFKAVPDVKRIMPAMKRHVLAGCVIVFSSVVPLKTDVQSADISLWAKSFGAEISDRVSSETTHVVAARVGTVKVKAAVKRGVKVVNTDWLLQSIQKWKKLDERPFMLKGIGQKELPAAEDVAPEPDLLAGLVGVGDVELSDDDVSDLNTEDDEPRKKPKLEIEIGEMESDDEALHSPKAQISAEGWLDMDDEIREAMGSDLDSESDAESVRSELSVRRKKRTREDESEGESGSDGERRNGDHSVKRQRSSALRAVKNAESSGNNTPMEQSRADYDEELAKELERELEREMEAAVGG